MTMQLLEKSLRTVKLRGPRKSLKGLSRLFAPKIEISAELRERLIVLFRGLYLTAPRRTLKRALTDDPRFPDDEDYHGRK